MNIHNLDFEAYMKIYNKAHSEMLKDLEQDKIKRKQKEFKTPEEIFAECDKLLDNLNIIKETK